MEQTRHFYPRTAKDGLTGLLGINIGGIPGTENPSAFTVFCILLATIAGGQIWLFKRMKWM
jgi:zinc transporter